ncbi:diphthamide synthase [Sporobolomyces koalae]|uniref:diphthamide synthase n=1 Tax=Sporobolomyces koalae TaxID=500713 RepID=UPI00316DAF4E
MQATSLSYVDTVYSADSIEFCFSRGAAAGGPHLFACGTYQVNKDETTPSVDGEQADPTVTRTGRCLLFSVDSDGSNLKELHRIESPAILDMKWSPRPWNGHEQVLAISDAKGHVQLHSLNLETNELSMIDDIVCADENILCLSLDWSTRGPNPCDPATIIVSLSNGSLVHLTPSDPENSTKLSPTKTWHAHNFEPWIVSFDCWNPNVIWSGGDDLHLKGWDLTREQDEIDMPLFVNKRFEGGVTTITSHPLVENLIAVGSYDASVRLFDKRNPLKPLTSFDVGGGIWRLKWHPTNPSRLLIAAMHNGFSVVDFDIELDAQTGSLQVGAGELVRRFEGHDSLAYGVDWSQSRVQTSDGRDLVASCSFYDHALHVWSV